MSWQRTLRAAVDTETRHGRKTSARGFDGYKGHIAIDPDSELVTATTVTAGNVGDAAPATDLLAEDLATTKTPTSQDTPAEDGALDEGGAGGGVAAQDAAQDQDGADPLRAYGDAAYGAGALVEQLEDAGAYVGCKVQPPTAPGGRFTKDAFDIDLPAGTVTCPNGASAPIRPARDGGGTAYFGRVCAGCPLAAQCTTSATGRSIGISRHEAALARARTVQRDPAWQADYRATRPKVERKIGHLMRRRHGGRRARVRGKTKIAADFSLLAAATNLARLAVLGVGHDHRGWVLRPA